MARHRRRSWPRAHSRRGPPLRCAARPSDPGRVVSHLEPRGGRALPGCPSRRRRHGGECAPAQPLGAADASGSRSPPDAPRRRVRTRAWAPPCRAISRSRGYERGSVPDSGGSMRFGNVEVRAVGGGVGLSDDAAGVGDRLRGADDPAQRALPISTGSAGTGRPAGDRHVLAAGFAASMRIGFMSMVDRYRAVTLLSSLAEAIAVLVAAERVGGVGVDRMIGSCSSGEEGPCGSNISVMSNGATR